ncbi:hypothetical protein JDV02_003268 [Purpureocillium takamizusanense]|uniref:Uncharacterized protein n=1 Tax=Purpureocillium takamizusanense TaxID=2060973 RepID=A0A9Q8QCV8_9HYPO|nr:uncharacterized protein JDV02_003268 [Purpureocillium takamizusanense]UNI16871.1 hypothetical protein JDV02_003268 [Purpureocillium takamizusanense]
MQSALRTTLCTRAVARTPSFRSPYHSTACRLLAYKDVQDRHTLSPRSDEHTKSATDDDVAALLDTAFGSNQPRPDKIIVSAEIESKGKPNPLEASGANPEISKPRGDERAEQYKVVVEKAEKSHVGGTPGKGEVLREYQKTRKITKLS